MDFVHYFSPVDRVGGKGRVNPKLLLGLVGITASLSNLPTSRLSRGEDALPPLACVCARHKPHATGERELAGAGGRLLPRAPVDGGRRGAGAGCGGAQAQARRGGHRQQRHAQRRAARAARGDQGGPVQEQRPVRWKGGQGASLPPRPPVQRAGGVMNPVSTLSGSSFSSAAERDAGFVHLEQPLQRVPPKVGVPPGLVLDDMGVAGGEPKRDVKVSEAGRHRAAHAAARLVELLVLRPLLVAREDGLLEVAGRGRRVAQRQRHALDGHRVSRGHATGSAAAQVLLEEDGLGAARLEHADEALLEVARLHRHLVERVNVRRDVLHRLDDAVAHANGRALLET
eukprot:scaffold12129_cov89-Isochrysis_galbana.AAC.1